MESLTNEFIERAKALIDKANNIVIVTHKNPDGDALGSGLALYNFFLQIKCNPVLIVPNQMPGYLKWMPGFEKIVVYEAQKELGAKLIQEAQLIFMVDFNHRSRLSELADKIIPSKASKILIDHHPYPETGICELLYSRISSSSTAEMVFEFIDKLYGRSKISKLVADCLYVGIMTDTGSFSYNSSQPYTFEVVGSLLASGIDKDDLTDKVYNNYSEHRLRLLGYAMHSKLKVIPESKAAYIALTMAELEEFHHEAGDTEGFVNFPLSIQGIVFTAIFIEKEKYTKCSFRSKGNFPANKVAADYFGGGGHLNAAGGEFKGDLPSALLKFEQVLPEYKTFL